MAPEDAVERARAEGRMLFVVQGNGDLASLFPAGALDEDAVTLDIPTEPPITVYRASR